MTHELKILEPFADDILKNGKRFEVRRNDRNFKTGDKIHFTAMDVNTGEPKRHPINEKAFEVGYILRFEDFPAGLQNGFAVFEITPEPGKWKETLEGYAVYYMCPACGEEYASDYGTPEEAGWHYCPECGARVEGTAMLPDWEDTGDEDEGEAEP